MPGRVDQGAGLAASADRIAAIVGAVQRTDGQVCGRAVVVSGWTEAHMCGGREHQAPAVVINDADVTPVGAIAGILPGAFGTVARVADDHHAGQRVASVGVREQIARHFRDQLPRIAPRRYQRIFINAGAGERIARGNAQWCIIERSYMHADDLGRIHKAAGAVAQGHAEAVGGIELAVIGINQRAEIGVTEYSAHCHRPATDGQFAVFRQTGQLEHELCVGVVGVHHLDVAGAEGQRAAELHDIGRQRRAAGWRLAGAVNYRHVVDRAHLNRQRAGRAGIDGVGHHRHRAVPVGERDKAVGPVGCQVESTLASEGDRLACRVHRAAARHGEAGNRERVVHIHVVGQHIASGGVVFQYDLHVGRHDRGVIDGRDAGAQRRATGADVGAAAGHVGGHVAHTTAVGARNVIAVVATVVDGVNRRTVGRAIPVQYRHKAQHGSAVQQQCR